MNDEELICSFCGRPKPQTDLLIAGLDAHICDKCIHQAHGIVVEESKEDDEGSSESESLDVKTPQLTKTFLDQDPLPYELASQELYFASTQLDFVFGKIDIESVLDEIFSSFCLGK